MIRRTALLLLAMGLISIVALANPQEYSRLARLSYLEGHVSFQHPNEVDWTSASINMALQPEDRIYTGDDGRAQIEFDDGSVLYLAEKTDVEILSLREDLVQIRILVGLCTLNAVGSVGYEFDTPAAAFNTTKKGVYRFDVADDGATDAIVRKGRLEAANNHFSRRIDSGDLVHVTPGDNGTQQVSRYDDRDAWDEWTDRRNADRMAYTSRRYIPDNVYMGVSELDRYGRWVVVDSYGPAWVPYYVDSGWSPYWEGRWCYRPFWGWTWVSYEPWGWLPYHYGRWHHAGFGWCWLPGPSFGFNFWSPGLVRFYYGSSWVSWAPLGPGDYYNVNHYYYNPIYRLQINNIRMIQNRAPDDLVNRNVPGAFRTVSTETFASSSLGGRGRTGPGESVGQPWRQGRMITDGLPVQPSSSSYAPVPDRPAVRPTMEKSLPSIVRTLPANESAGRDRFVRITNPSAGTVNPGSRLEGRTVAGANESAGRSIVGTRGESPSTSGGDVGRSNGGGGNPASSIWNRRPDSVEPSSAGGRVNQTPQPRSNKEVTPRVYGRETPGSSGSRMGPPSRGSEAAPARPSVIERPRANDREAPRPSNPRPESIQPRGIQSAPTPRNERSTPSPRPQTERSRPSGSESNGYDSRSSWQRDDSSPFAGIDRSAPVGRMYEAPAARSAAPSYGSGRPAYSVPSTPFSGGGRAVYSAPATPSSSWGGSGGGVSIGGSHTTRSSPAPSAPARGAGISRPRGR